MYSKHSITGLACLGLAQAVIALTVWLGSYTDDPPVLVLRHSQVVQALAFSPDGRLLATGGGLVGHPSELRLWDPATGTELRRLLCQTGSVHAVAFSPDGTLLASGGWDGAVRLWETASGRLLETLRGPDTVVSTLAFTDGGRSLASIGINGMLVLWDPVTGQERRRVTGVRAASPDGRLLATGDLAVQLRDRATLQERAVVAGHTAWVSCLAFSPPGGLLASGSCDGTVCLWDPCGGRLQGVLHGHADWVNGMAFSTDGRLLVTADSDRLVCVWDPADGRLLGTFRGHLGAVTAVAFSPDGKTIASASYDQTVQLWPAPR
jgi:WD40 repeat protein